MNLGKTLIQLREDQGLNQGQMAEALGITQTYLSLIENNKRLPNMLLLEKMSKQMSVPLPLIFFLSLDEKDVPQKKMKDLKVILPLVRKLAGELKTK